MHRYTEELYFLTNCEIDTFAKPFMIVNENNLGREMTTPSNWTIANKSHRYIMNRPNDIGLYISIANRALKRAEVKFKEIHSKEITYLIIDEDTVSEFYDYFEEII